jgi:membrane protein YqaA with SNARE-associated domain
MLIDWGYLGLFVGTFVSSTLIPFPSEALVIGFYELNNHFWAILLVATVGNFLGGLTNYYIGFKSNSERLKKRFKLNEEKILGWEKRLSRYGSFLGLLSWVPFVGDPMIAVLGFLKVKFLPLALMMLIGKFLRYFILLYFYKSINLSSILNFIQIA